MHIWSDVQNYTINLQNSSGSSISGSHCAVNSTNIFILSDSTFKVYKFSLSNFQNTTTDNATTSWGSGGSGSGQYMGYGSIIADENYNIPIVSHEEEPIKITQNDQDNAKVLQFDIKSAEHSLRHDSNKLSSSIKKIYNLWINSSN